MVIDIPMTDAPVITDHIYCYRRRSRIHRGLQTPLNLYKPRMRAFLTEMGDKPHPTNVLRRSNLAQFTASATTYASATVLASDVHLSNCSREGAQHGLQPFYPYQNAFIKLLSNLRTGVVLLILSASRPRWAHLSCSGPPPIPTNSPRLIRRRRCIWLDRLALTDVFHAWWFLTLLGLVSLSIVLVSIDRFPNAWRFYARPYRKTDSHFRSAVPNRVELPIKNAEEGLNAAERALKKIRLAGRTHRRQDRTLLVFRTSSFLGHGGVHRPRQPASDLCRRHHRRRLRLQRLHGAAKRPDQQHHRNAHRRNQDSFLSA